MTLMDIYFAPMEGVTDHIYRRVHRDCFAPGAARYFTPFLSPTQNHIFPPRELRQVLPENNRGIPLTPQLLTKNAADFLWAAGELAAMGYEEVNLNVGCPSGTVTAKGKGAGLLADRDSLRRLMDGIFSTECPVRVSVKTRLGVRDPEEFFPILDIYNDYPLCQLIIHARTRQEMYAGPVHLDVFAAALEASRAPVCYNGDILSLADVAALTDRFPALDAVMAGRGLVSRPWLTGGQRDTETVRRFHRALCEAYCAAFGGPGSAIHRMKAIWSYMLEGFRGGAQYEKALGKTRCWEDFLVLTERIMDQCPLTEAPASAIFERSIKFAPTDCNLAFE